MTLEQLRMLVAVAQCKTIKQASEQLCKTQPAISQGIKQLEAQLRVTLFSREQYRLELTSEGRKIYQRALLVLRESLQIQQLAKHLASGNEAKISLAFDASFDLDLILPILENTQTEYPETQIVIRQEFITGAFDALQQNRADIVVSTAFLQPRSLHDVEQVLIARGRLINVAAPRLLARYPDLCSVVSLRDEYQILVQDSGTGTQGFDINVQLGQRCWYVNDFATKRKLVLSGMGWGRLPEYLIRDYLHRGELVALSLGDVDNVLVFDYYAMRLKHQIAGPAASALWSRLVDLAD